MKYLLVLIVVVLGLWVLLRKRGGGALGTGTGKGSGSGSEPPAAKPRPTARLEPAAMVACAHCDLRLPEGEAQFDALGRPFCSEAHRLAGPR